MIKVEIVTAKGYSTYDCTFVLARGSDGDRGYLPSHSPVVMTIPEGYLRLDHDSIHTFVYIKSGILDLKNDIMTITSEISFEANTLEEAKAEYVLNKQQTIKENKRKNVDFVMNENELIKTIKKIRAGKI